MVAPSQALDKGPIAAHRNRYAGLVRLRTDAGSGHQKGRHELLHAVNFQGWDRALGSFLALIGERGGSASFTTDEIEAAVAPYSPNGHPGVHVALAGEGRTVKSVTVRLQPLTT